MYSDQGSLHASEREVAGSNPAPGSIRRDSSGVEREKQLSELVRPSTIEFSNSAYSDSTGISTTRTRPTSSDIKTYPDRASVHTG